MRVVRCSVWIEDGELTSSCLDSGPAACKFYGLREVVCVLVYLRGAGGGVGMFGLWITVCNLNEDGARVIRLLA